MENPTSRAANVLAIIKVFITVFTKIITYAASQLDINEAKPTLGVVGFWIQSLPSIIFVSVAIPCASYIERHIDVKARAALVGSIMHTCASVVMYMYVKTRLISYLWYATILQPFGAALLLINAFFLMPLSDAGPRPFRKSAFCAFALGLADMSTITQVVISKVSSSTAFIIAMVCDGLLLCAYLDNVRRDPTRLGWTDNSLISWLKYLRSPLFWKPTA